MSLARYFSKPRWQSRDEAIRRAAVAGDTDGALIESLPKLAREDSDAGVRLAAMRRLADPGLTQAMAVDDRDEGVRDAARNLWAELLAGTHSAAPSLADRLRLLRAQDDPRLVEYIAVNAPEAELRLAALQRIDRQALLLERITADADAGIRLAALERIENEDHLARIVERTRKSDKVINRLAGERLENLRVERGDAAAIERRARSLCERMERVLREGDGSDEAASIHISWSAVAAKAPAVYSVRYQNARELFDLSRNPAEVARLRQRAQDRVRIEQELGDLERLLAQPTAPAQCDVLVQRYEALTPLHLAFADGNDESGASISVRYARAGAQISALQASMLRIESAEADQARNDREREQVRAERDARKSSDRLAHDRAREKTLAALQCAIEATALAIRSGKTAEAHARHAELVPLLRQIGPLPAAQRDALAEVESEYAKIVQWQRWSDNQRRQQMCEELEALPQSGLHPDALATRLREIQAEWSLLDRIEARPAQANDGLARRFRALCRRAIEPAKPYFEKRDELRKQGTQETGALIRDARAAAVAEIADWRDLAAVRKRLADALHSLDRVDPRERKALAAELKVSLGMLDERVQAENRAIESTKNDLIARAVALAEQSDSRTAMAQARDLQKLWQKAGSGRRSRDQAQWKAFRAALDAVFARADNERNERAARDQDALASATALCTELEAMAGAGSEPDRAALKRIDAAWRGLACGDAALRQRYQSALDQLQAVASRIARNRKRAQYDVWLAHYDALRRFENAEFDKERLSGIRSVLSPLTLTAQEFENRIECVGTGLPPTRNEEGRIRDCVLEVEQLAGIEPPAEDRQRRMDMQVERLSARMRGEQAPAPEAVLQRVLSDWLQAGPTVAQPAALESRFLTAIHAVLDMLGQH